MTPQNFNDALVISVFVDQAAHNIRNYFKEHMPGWQGENLQNILSIAVFVYDGHEERRKAEQVKERKKRWAALGIAPPQVLRQGILLRILRSRDRRFSPRIPRCRLEVLRSLGSVEIQKQGPIWAEQSGSHLGCQIVAVKSRNQDSIVGMTIKQVFFIAALGSTGDRSATSAPPAQPVNIKTEGGHPPPAVKQYPSPQEAEKSIQNQIDSYLAQGILKNRLDGDGDPKYRFVQDLWVVNQHVVTPHPVVPDPSTILLQIPHWARYFTVIDLRAAFFSIPLDDDSQLLFDLMWKGQQLTWMGLPQGFAGSPTIFSMNTEKLFERHKITGQISPLSKDEDACIKDTIHLCTALAEKDHRASPSKLQLCQKEVKYLGFILREGQWVTDPERIEAIIKLPRLVTKKQLRGFLGTVGFCRPWIPGLGELTSSLTEATRNPLICMYMRIASGVITQKLGPHHRPDAYYSIQLDPVAAGAPACNKSVAAAVAILEKSRPLILGHPVTIYVPHEVEILLKQYATQALSPQRAHRYELILLMADNVTLQRCNTLNPAMLLPLPDEGEENHQCERIMLTSSKPRTDLTDVPLQNPDLALFVDGSSYYLHGQ
ncbi:LOW QUALITY PROTEIN: hypothetical protein QYF61_007359 [Mycteria americana]|uniref:ribonuclease H n=1 Tax=Mycteria americana TaxID=33587 RepID=A0AAN7N8K8_MYCAM|nr:LOW QUALITY PROTEIN: hypothetical protein QYF61_007359 [Mycteria americana]